MSSFRFRLQVAKLLRLTPICAGIVVAGCGGGGGGTAAGPSGSQNSTHAGNATALFSGHPHALEVVSAGSVSAFSQAGASFTGFTVTPTASLSTTSLAFTRGISGESIQLFTAPADGSGQPSLLVHTTISGYGTYANSGIMGLITQVNGQYSIQTILPDGTAPHVVLSNVPGVPTISPNSQTIAYLNASVGDIYTIPVGGGSSTTIFNGGTAAGAPVVYSPSGTQIAFTAKDGTGHFNVYTMANTGGVATSVLPASYVGTGDALANAWSPDGLSLACTWTATSATTSQILVISLNGGGSGIQTPATFSDSYACYSPDNKKMAFYRSNAGGASPGIYESDFDGLNPNLVIPDPSTDGPTGPVESLVWSHFPPSVKFLGTGGSVATTASGFLMAQKNSQFASLLSMLATTPSTATITPTGTQSAGGPLVYTLAADSVTNVSFTNAYLGSRTSINLTTTPTVVVSIDGGTGLVDFVAPGIFKKGPGGTYVGNFKAIYDRTGKNIAPAGASSIDVDHSTGKLISFH